MTQKQRVLIAYDGSPDSEDALKLGRRLCRSFGAKPLIAYRGGRILPEMKTGYYKNIVDRSPARGLCMLAEEIRPMALVVGNALPDLFGHVRAGGGGKRILGRACCPIAVASPRPEQDDGFSDICVAVEGGSGSSKALVEAASMARVLGVRLRIVSVLASVAGTRRNGWSPNNSRVRRAVKTLELAAKRVESMVAVEVEGLVGDPGPRLAEFSEGFDLMLIGARNHGFRHRRNRGVASYLMDHTRCPILITPERTLDQSVEFGGKKPLPVAG